MPKCDEAKFHTQLLTDKYNTSLSMATFRPLSSPYQVNIHYTPAFVLDDNVANTSHLFISFFVFLNIILDLCQ